MYFYLSVLKWTNGNNGLFGQSALKRKTFVKASSAFFLLQIFSLYLYVGTRRSRNGENYFTIFVIEFDGDTKYLSKHCFCLF